ncbi:hypothetical protein [Actinokineospora inagensis]|uniref:hypothetical protein n=1 Tax=Actinokineospora inagensis TaxID=103730 RepID=UPI0004173325|nr:hypothetical protein [Actinokineospora inagensis]
MSGHDDVQTREATATRRVLSRALLVLGGTLAGTAAAWAFATATASADVATDLQHDLRSVVDAAPDAPALVDVKTALVGLTDRVGTLVGEPVDATRVTEVSHQATRTATQATQAVDQFGRDLARQLRPVRLDLPLGGSAGRGTSHQVAPAAGPTGPLADPAPGSPDVTQADPAATSAAPAAQVADRHPAGATRRAAGTGLSQRGSPETADARADRPNPTRPTGPSPLAPLSMPAPAGPVNTTGAGAADALGHGLVAVTPADSDTTPALAHRATPVVVVAAVAAQPGVTPD